MLLYSSQTFCIAADTAANVSFLSAAQLIRPGRIGNQLAAHGSIGNAAVGKLLLHKVRIRQPAHTAYRQLRNFPHTVTLAQKTAFFSKIRMIGRRYGIRKAGMIRQHHMKAVNPCLFQHGNKYREFFR